MLTLYLGANRISSLKATSVPTTPSRIPWDNCTPSLIRFYGEVMLFVEGNGNTYSLFLLTEYRHGYRGHQEQALGLSVEKLQYRGIKYTKFLTSSISVGKKKHCKSK